MKIAVLFTGILRTDLKETIQNISFVCNNFKGHDVKSYFVTWTLPDNVATAIKNNVDFFHMDDEPPVDWVVKNVPSCGSDRNKSKNPTSAGSYLNIYYMLKCRQMAMRHLEEVKEFVPDYVLLLRNDAVLHIKNLSGWINDMYNTANSRASRRREGKNFSFGTNQINDHFGFASYKVMHDALIQDDEFIKNIISKSFNAENAVFNLVKSTKAKIKRHNMLFAEYYLLEGINGNHHVYREDD